MRTQDESLQMYYLGDDDDINAWEHTYEIRSHRAVSARNPIHVGLGFLLLLITAGTLMNASAVSSRHEALVSPTQTAPEKPLTVEIPPVVAQSTDERQQERASRTEARKPPTPEPDKIEKVIAWAIAQQGKPYRFGSAGPNSFDCSGLVLQAFAQVGVKLPHYTGTMVGYGKKVAKADLQRGDIIFPTSGHVVIYLGNGMQIGTSSSKGKVVIQKVYGFYTARRLV